MPFLAGDEERNLRRLTLPPARSIRKFKRFLAAFKSTGGCMQGIENPKLTNSGFRINANPKSIHPLQMHYLATSRCQRHIHYRLLVYIFHHFYQVVKVGIRCRCIAPYLGGVSAVG